MQDYISLINDIGIWCICHPTIFKSNEEKAKTFIEANYAITEEEKNIILDAIRNNITNEMTTHKKEEVNLTS